jgi:lipopolysaccharide/colanic/teichoic acid biosynthesis glycosyltransferase
MFAHPMPLRAPARPGPATDWKRPLDLGVVILGLIAIWPLFLLIALAIRLSSAGPVFFVQTRIGRDGRPFGMIKFRSMYRDAEARRAALVAQSDRDGLCFKSRNDPRITPVGRILRRLSLDELPQVINVLRGDMSLVGPRPALPEEVAAYPARALGRLAVPPGITGLWQVSGRADVGFDEMIDLDLAYVRDASLATDLAILMRTTGAVVTGRGAY